MAGLLTGVGGSYGAEFLSAAFSPEELTDSLFAAPVRTLIVPQRKPEFQGELWIYPGKVSSDPRAAAQLSAGTATSFDDFHRKMYAAGFHDLYVTFATLLIEGRRNAPVRIIEIRARILRRQSTTPETYSIVGPGAEGGTEESISIGFDLSDRDPVARRAELNFEDGVKLGDPFFSTSNTELGRGETEVYSITAVASKDWDIEWEIEVLVLAPGETEPVAVFAQRPVSPFRTISGLYNEQGDFDISKYAEIYGHVEFSSSGAPGRFAQKDRTF
jgi:hypothetical protein